jgi:ribosome-binding protein aMBF1 (putative translation factor)
VTSFQISITPSRRAAGRFISEVRRKLQKALTDEHAKSGLTQSDIARTIDVHRSVINRELRGYKDITLGRLAELAFAMGLKPKFELVDEAEEFGANVPVVQTTPHRTFVLSATPQRVMAEVEKKGSHKVEVKTKYVLEAA